MKDKRQSHFADTGLSGEQVGIPAALISVSGSGGNYRDLAALLRGQMAPTVRGITLCVIKSAALVSARACPVTHFCVRLQVEF